METKPKNPRPRPKHPIDRVIPNGEKQLAKAISDEADGATPWLKPIKINKGGRPSSYDPTWMNDAVLEAGAAGGTHAEMIYILNVAPSTFYLWLNKHPEFSESVKIAENMSRVWWERIGKYGMLGEIEGFRDTNWIFSMKNRFAEHYRDARHNVIDNKQPIIDARSVTINARELDEEVRDNIRRALMAANLLTDQREDDDE